MGNFRAIWAAKATTESPYIVVPARQNKQAVIKKMVADAGHASDLIKIFPCRQAGYTENKVAIVANDDEGTFDGDATADTLNGNTVAINDFILMNLDDRSVDPMLGAWQLMLIAGMGGETADTLDITDLTGYNSEQVPRAGMAVDKPAFIIWAEDVITLPLADAAVDYEWISAGWTNYPLVIQIVNGGSAAVNLGGLIEYF